MQLRQLGRSGISIAPLAFGGNVFGWSADEQRSFELLDAFVDAGFNLIDTADVYSAWKAGNRGGESETILGKWLKRSGKRDKVIIATKVGKWVEHRGLSPININEAIEGSLKRLQTDHIDLYQAHEDDATVPLSETLGAFGRLIEKGKVRSIGASNYRADRLADALQVSRQHNLPRYESLQPEYNLVSRSGYEKGLEPLIRQEGIGVINYYALASGFLSGKYRSEADLSKSSVRGGAVKKFLTAQGMKVLAALDDIATAHNATPSQIALAWLIARPGITAPIVSATTLEQWQELMGAATLTLTPADIAALDDASASF
jgi:aryl-alcohol dehydrogenase-like predicted oxidoreductase